MSEKKSLTQENGERISVLERVLEALEKGMNAINGKVDGLVEAQTEFMLQSTKYEGRQLQILEQISKTQNEMKELRDEYRTYTKDNDDRVTDVEKVLIKMESRRETEKDMKAEPWSIQKKIAVQVGGSLTLVITLYILSKAF